MSRSRDEWAPYNLTRRALDMAVYGKPIEAPAHMRPDLPELTARQDSLRARVCVNATTLHDRLVALADILDADPTDKDAVRGWLFAAQPDEVWPPPANRPCRWTGDT